jgi:hypothetical protein
VRKPRFISNLLVDEWIVAESARERAAKDAASPREMKVFILAKKVNANEW